MRTPPPQPVNRPAIHWPTFTPAPLTARPMMASAMTTPASRRMTPALSPLPPASKPGRASGASGGALDPEALLGVDHRADDDGGRNVTDGHDIGAPRKEQDGGHGCQNEH